jgi:cytochrome c556
MRIAVLAATVAAAFLSGCGGSQSSQADKSSANGNGGKPSVTSDMVMLSAVPSNALQIQRDRHDAMEQLGRSMKSLHRGLDASPPDVNAIRTQTAIMVAVAARIPAMFPPRTGPEVGKTRAKPEIWRQHDLFIRRAKEYQAAALAIDAAAKSGDMHKVMALHENVDKACKACHDPFRAPEH